MNFSRRTFIKSLPLTGASTTTILANPLPNSVLESASNADSLHPRNGSALGL